MLEKEIPGFNGVYKISDTGIVTREWNSKVLVLSKQIDKCGYVRVNLSNGGEQKPYLLHRLLAATFIENKNNLSQVNHIDGNKLNNSLSNLEWCTCKENIIHAFRNNLRPNSSGERHHNARKIRCVTTNTTYSTLTEAAKALGTDTNSIWRACCGLRKTFRKQVWEYAD